MDRAAMKFNKPAHNGKTKTAGIATFRVRRVDTIKRFEDFFQTMYCTAFMTRLRKTCRRRSASPTTTAGSLRSRVAVRCFSDDSTSTSSYSSPTNWLSARGSRSGTSCPASASLSQSKSKRNIGSGSKKRCSLWPKSDQFFVTMIGCVV